MKLPKVIKNRRNQNILYLLFYYVVEVNVKNLQAALFPITSPRGTGSFLANFLLKSPHTDIEENLRLPKIKESQSRELFSLSKDQSFTFQLPRWPTECQVRF